MTAKENKHINSDTDSYKYYEILFASRVRKCP